MRGKVVSGIMLALLLANMLTVEIQPTKSATTTLVEQIVTSLNTISNWTADEKLGIQGIIFNKHSKTNYDAIVSNAHAMGDWKMTIIYARIAEVDGYWSETIELKLKDALNNTLFFPNYSLPRNYPKSNPHSFQATQAANLAGYQYARMLNTNIAGWDPVSGFEGLRRLWDSVEHPFHYGNPETLSMHYRFGGRYYMCGFLMECFRYFWLENVTDAWVYMNKTWNALNEIHWSGTHFNYAPNWPSWEKTVYPLYMSVIKFYVENNRSLVWWNRLLADIQNRYLVDWWESPQWSIGTMKFYATVHHSPSNSERILDDVIAAWYLLHMFYGSLNAANQAKMRDMLEGFDDEDPAWKSLLKTNSGLFEPETNQFKSKSTHLEPTDWGTASGALAMVLQGISPQSGRGLALPAFGPIVWSMGFAWPFSDSFSFDVDNRTLTIPVWRETTLKFLYGSSPFNETFSETGVWECIFASDWNSLISKRRISTLPTENWRYEYLHLPVYNINSNLYYATIQEAINAHETSDGDTIFVEAGTYYEHVIVNKSISLIGENRSTTIIDGNGNSIVVEVRADNITLSNFTIQNSGQGFDDGGIKVFCSNSSHISYNLIENNNYGIILIGSSHNVVLSNVISNNAHTGIHSVSLSANNTFAGNVISNNKWGIQVIGSDKNCFAENEVFLNGEIGIYLSGSRKNTLLRNNLSRNYHGISLWDSSNNTICENNISYSQDGIVLANSSISYFCANNTIYHNNFINNTKSAHPVSDFPPLRNIWDSGYPSGGNYWSDYTGVDVKSGPNQDQPSSDGIGDTSYVIDANNTDHYPLMYPWGSPPPLSYNLTIYSEPMGIPFTVNGVSCITLWSGTYSEGTEVNIVMPETYHYNYEWRFWFEDGDRNRIKTVIMDTNITLWGWYAIVEKPEKLVGGKAVPIDKLIIEPEAQIPWIGLSTIIFSLLATGVFVKLKKRKQ